MIKNGDTKYTYAVARIHAMEKKLLTKEKLGWMIESKTALDATKILINAEYGYTSLKVPQAKDYEKLLIEEEQKLYSVIGELIEEPEVLEIFKLKFDYQNIKVLLKSEAISKKDFESLLTNLGTIPLEKLQYMISERKMDGISRIMIDAVSESLDKYNRTKNPQFIDIILDNAYFNQIVRLAKKSNNEFLSKLLITTIDLENIKSWLRVQKLKMPVEFLKSVLLKGGAIKEEYFYKYNSSKLKAFIQDINEVGYKNSFDEGFEHYTSVGNLSILEKCTDNYIIEFIKKAKIISFGIEPLIAYLVAKENEIKNVRIIMIGKMNDISKEIIYERLRDSYV